MASFLIIMRRMCMVFLTCSGVHMHACTHAGTHGLRPAHKEDRLCLTSGSVGSILGKALSTTDYWNTVKQTNKQTKAGTHAHTHQNAHAHMRAHKHEHTRTRHALSPLQQYTPAACPFQVRPSHAPTVSKAVQMLGATAARDQLYPALGYNQ